MDGGQTRSRRSRSGPCATSANANRRCTSPTGQNHSFFFFVILSSKKANLNQTRHQGVCKSAFARIDVPLRGVPRLRIFFLSEGASFARAAACAEEAALTVKSQTHVPCYDCHAMSKNKGEELPTRTLRFTRPRRGATQLRMEEGRKHAPIDVAEWKQHLRVTR